MAKHLSDTRAVMKNLSKTASLISETMRRNSVSRMAKDSIFEYPFFVSGDIDVNEVLTFAKAFERQIAAMVVSQISLNNYVDLKKYGSIQEWLKTIHNNSDIPANIVAMISNATEAFDIPMEEKLNIAIECWRELYPEESLDTSSLNDIYKPYRKTQAILEDGYKLATEAKSNPLFGSDALRAANNAASDAVRDLSPNKHKIGDRTVKSTTSEYNHRTEVSKKKTEYNTPRPNSFQVLNSDVTNTLAPTMINVELICDIPGKNKPSMQVSVVIGVKTMIRRIRSDAMVSNMIDAVRGSNSIFNFIKYTDTEKNSFVQFLIKPFTDGKDMAIGKNAGDDGFVKALQRRKSFNAVSKIGGGSVPPHTVIIISTFEAARVKELTGVDLMDAYYVMKIIAKYYILGFGIYDTESKIMLSMFDGDSTWATNTLYSLGVANKSNVNFADLAETKSLMNRR